MITVINKTLLLIWVVSLTTAALGQKKSNLFLTAEFSEEAGATVAYSYAIKEKFGIGAAVQVLDFSGLDDGSVSALADFRYYHTINKSCIIPVVQIGKYMYDYGVAGTTNAAITGGLHVALGLGYSYSLWGKGGGLFGSLMYRSISVDSETNNVNTSSSDDQIVFSIGVRL